MLKPIQPLRALLIGIDRYLEGPPGAFKYGDLRGAVSDVLRVDAYLRDLQVPESAIMRLLSPHEWTDPKQNATEHGRKVSALATHDNLSAAFAALEAACQPGEQALVYYSGHGGRAPTVVPEIKGLDALDAVLVPADIGDPAVPYLHDVELIAWLRRCAARGVFVTLILDCCFSAGAVRLHRRMRGHEEVDRTLRPKNRLLTSRDDIEAIWRAPRFEAQRGRFEMVGNYAQVPSGYALLAACRPHEVAVEVEQAGCWGGVMTHFLLTILSRANEPYLTYRHLHAKLIECLHAAGYFGQTPVVDGEADRLIFGLGTLRADPSIKVLEVARWPGERVRLATGAVHGTRRGSCFALVSAPVCRVRDGRGTPRRGRGHRGGRRDLLGSTQIGCGRGPQNPRRRCRFPDFPRPVR